MIGNNLNKWLSYLGKSENKKWENVFLHNTAPTLLVGPYSKYTWEWQGMFWWRGWGDGRAWQPMQCRLIIKLALGKQKFIGKLLLASVWCLIWQPRHKVLSLLARARRNRWQFIFCTNVFDSSASEDRRQRLWTCDQIGRCARLTCEGLNLNNYPCTACKASGYCQANSAS